MNLRENIRIALSSIRSNKLRSVLTMLGIIIGVASVISIVTVGNSGKEFLIDKINEAGGQSLSIGMNNQRGEDSKYSIDGLTNSDLETIRSVDLIQYVSPLFSDFGPLQTTFLHDGMASVTASNSDYANMMKLEMVHGRFFSEEEYKSNAKVCLLTDNSAYKFFHMENPVGETVDLTLNDRLITLKVIGVVKVNDSGLFSEDDMQEMMGSYLPRTFRYRYKHYIHNTYSAYK